jgi:hypothetical protein
MAMTSTEKEPKKERKRRERKKCDYVVHKVQFKY